MRFPIFATTASDNRFFETERFPIPSTTANHQSKQLLLDSSKFNWFLAIQRSNWMQCTAIGLKIRLENSQFPIEMASRAPSKGHRTIELITVNFSFFQHFGRAPMKPRNPLVKLIGLSNQLNFRHLSSTAPLTNWSTDEKDWPTTRKWTAQWINELVFEKRKTNQFENATQLLNTKQTTGRKMRTQSGVNTDSGHYECSPHRMNFKVHITELTTCR